MRFPYSQLPSKLVTLFLVPVGGNPQRIHAYVLTITYQTANNKSTQMFVKRIHAIHPVLTDGVSLFNTNPCFLSVPLRYSMNHIYPEHIGAYSLTLILDRSMHPTTYHTGVAVLNHTHRYSY